MTYNLDDLIPHYGNMSFIHVFGPDCHFSCIGDIEEEPKTFRQILTMAKFDFELPTPTFIIVEHPLGGEIYQIGNYTDNKIMEKLKNQFTINLDDETARAVEALARITQRKPAELLRLLVIPQVFAKLSEAATIKTEIKPAHFNPSPFDL